MLVECPGIALRNSKKTKTANAGKMIKIKINIKKGRVYWDNTGEPCMGSGHNRVFPAGECLSFIYIFKEQEHRVTIKR